MVQVINEFTIKVKEELLTLHRFEKSELSALIKMSGSLGLSMGGLKFVSDNGEC